MISTGKLISLLAFMVDLASSINPPLFLIFSNCRSTEHDHVKANLPAKLLRIRTFGKIELAEFKDLISPANYMLCEKAAKMRTTWYKLTVDVFIKFLYKVICLSLRAIYLQVQIHQS